MPPFRILASSTWQLGSWFSQWDRLQQFTIMTCHVITANWGWGGGNVIVMDICCTEHCIALSQVTKWDIVSATVGCEKLDPLIFLNNSLNFQRRTPKPSATCFYWPFVDYLAAHKSFKNSIQYQFTEKQGLQIHLFSCSWLDNVYSSCYSKIYLLDTACHFIMLFLCEWL